MNDLEKLCRPLLTCVCDYWQYINAGNRPEKETFLKRINSLLADAKEEAAKSPALEKEFARIERPLIFFVDYMVKEGNFPFNREWRELARNYNELSGDEKFFDLLSEALDDPDSGDVLEVFYTMLGLGFDGIYHNNPEYIERRMKVCASRFSQSKFDVSSEMITPVDTMTSRATTARKSNPFKTVKFALAVCFLVMAVSFGINLSYFLKATKDYRHVLSVAAESAIPKSFHKRAGQEDEKPSSDMMFWNKAE